MIIYPILTGALKRNFRLLLENIESKGEATHPFARFNRILQHTAAKYGIAVAEREESYTSKADFLAGDSIPVYGQKNDAEYVFSGRRIRRGLYKNAEGIILNADVNGAANILRKSYPDAYTGTEPDVFCKVEKIVVNMKSKPIYVTNL